MQGFTCKLYVVYIQVDVECVNSFSISKMLNVDHMSLLFYIIKWCFSLIRDNTPHMAIHLTEARLERAPWRKTKRQLLSAQDVKEPKTRPLRMNQRLQTNLAIKKALVILNSQAKGEIKTLGSLNTNYMI